MNSMVCDNCGSNPAKVHVTKIVNNQMNTFHLCEGCAADKGLEPENVGDFALTDFLAQMGKGSTPETEKDEQSCSYCGLELTEFKKSGRLGCPQCYVTYEQHLRNLLRRLHGGTQHVGKVYLPPDPTEAERQDRLLGLRRKLDQAITTEDFERAATLRDEIRSLETGHDDGLHQSS